MTQMIPIPDPYPQTVGVSALMILVRDDFRGDAEITWWIPGHDRDEDRRRVTCSTTALLQGVFHDVARWLGEKRLVRDDHAELSLHEAAFSPEIRTRVVALVTHAFYRERVARAARLEAAYAWKAWT